MINLDESRSKKNVPALHLRKIISKRKRFKYKYLFVEHKKRTLDCLALKSSKNIIEFLPKLNKKERAQWKRSVCLSENTKTYIKSLVQASAKIISTEEKLADYF